MNKWINKWWIDAYSELFLSPLFVNARIRRSVPACSEPVLVSWIGPARCTHQQKPVVRSNREYGKALVVESQKAPRQDEIWRESSPGCHSRRSARWNSGSPWLNTETNTEYSIECHALSTGTKNRGVLTKIMPVILILLILLILLFWLLFWLFSVTWYRINCKYTTVC